MHYLLCCLLAHILNFSSLDLTPEDLALCEQFPLKNYEIHVTPNHGSFYIDDAGGIKQDIKKDVIWEKEVLAAIEKYTIPGSTVIDVGAYIGTHSVIMSRAAGPHGRVYAFEPQSKIFCELAANLLLNNCQNVTPKHCALGDKNQIVHLDPVLSDNESARTIGLGEETASMYTLDSFDLNNISLIKIDVENFEEQVLQGAKQTVHRNKPVLIIEILGHKEKAISRGLDLKSETRRIINKITVMGYQVKTLGCDYLAIPNHMLQRAQ